MPCRARDRTAAPRRIGQARVRYRTGLGGHARPAAPSGCACAYRQTHADSANHVQWPKDCICARSAGRAAHRCEHADVLFQHATRLSYAWRSADRPSGKYARGFPSGNDRTGVAAKPGGERRPDRGRSHGGGSLCAGGAGRPAEHCAGKAAQAFQRGDGRAARPSNPTLSMRWLKPSLLGLLVAMSAGAAAVPIANGDPPGVAVARPQILVMIRMAPAHFRPGTAYDGDYGGPQAESARKRLAKRIARHHDLALVDGWPMPLLDVDCFVMEVRGRSPEAAAAE